MDFFQQDQSPFLFRMKLHNGWYMNQVGVCDVYREEQEKEMVEEGRGGRERGGGEKR